MESQKVDLVKGETRMNRVVNHGKTIKMDFYVCKRLIRECNAKDLQKAWKRFLQNEKEKTKTQNKKAEEKN